MGQAPTTATTTQAPTTASTTQAPTTGAKAVWIHSKNDAVCDTTAGEVVSGQSPGNLETCKKSCEDDAGCQSITYFSTGLCARFSTQCMTTAFMKGAVAMRLGIPTTQAPTT